MLRVFTEYQPFPFPLAPGEKIQPNCWQILLMSAVFAIFVYPLLYKLGKAGRANEKIRDYVPMTIGLILIGTEIYKQILMLYHFNWKYHFYLLLKNIYLYHDNRLYIRHIKQQHQKHN